MPKSVEFYFDYGSPTSYLAWTQLPAICQRTGAELIYRPILLGGLFKATGNRSPIEVPAKRHWMDSDLQRFATRYGVPFTMNPYFPINTLALMRGAMWAVEAGALETYNHAVFSAIWVNQANMGEAESVAQVLTAAGLDVAQFFAAIATPAVKQQLIDATQAATDRGLFGAPTMFVGDQMYFGQDRLDYVERELAG